MKRRIATIASAALALAFAAALFGCSSGNAPAPQSEGSSDAVTSAAVEAPTAEETSAPAETSADVPGATAIEAIAGEEAAAEVEEALAEISSDYDIADVSPDMVAKGDEFVALVDQYVAKVDEAKATGSIDGVIDDINALNSQLTGLAEELQGMCPDDTESPDFAYYSDVVVKASLRMADAGFELLDLV